MSRKEWIEQFIAINGRQPSHEELGQALAAGDFKEETPQPAQSQASNPAQTTDQPTQERSAQESSDEGQLPNAPQNHEVSPSQASVRLTDQATPLANPRKRNKWLVLGLGLVAVLAVILAGSSSWQYFSGKLQGTYQLVYLKEHETGQVHKYENNKYTFTNFYASVKSDNSLQLFNQESQIDDYNYGYPAIELETYINTPLKVSPFTRKIQPTQSTSAFKSYLTKLLKDKFSDRFTNEEDLNAEVATYVKPYREVSGEKPKNTISYSKDGDKVTVLIRKSSGKVRYTMVFKKLSDKDAKKVLAQYQDDRKEFEKLYRTY